MSKKKATTAGVPETPSTPEIAETTQGTPTIQEPITPEQHKQLGRPSDPNSVRQQKIRERNEKREQGLLKRGRPVVEGSNRQVTLAKRAEKVASGVELKKGRPVNPDSKRQLELIEKAKRAEARTAAAVVTQ